MKIWIDDKWYSPKDTLIVVRLTEKDKENIKNMSLEYDLYSEYEESYISKKEVTTILKRLKNE